MSFEPSLYFAPRALDGRVARGTFAVAGLRYGAAFLTCGSLASAGIVGTFELVIVSNFSTALLVMWGTNSIPASLFFEYFETASCHPPTVATELCPGPWGSGATANLPATFEPL